MNSDLKPCPFCGGEAHLSNWTDQAYVWCECGVKTEVYLQKYGGIDKAVQTWNSRAENSENANRNDPEAAGYEPLGSRSWIIIKRTKLATETVKQLFTSQESAEDYIRQATKKWGKAFMKGFTVEEVPVKVEKASYTERTAKVDWMDGDSYCDCGQELRDSFVYCPGCGAKLDWSVEKCQPEKPDNFEIAKRKGNDES